MIVRVNDRVAWQALAPRLAERREQEALIASQGRGREAWDWPGYCEVCGQERRFRLDWMYSDGETPNFRERLICESCQLNNRQRFAMSLLLGEAQALMAGRPPAVYLYEQVTYFYKAARLLLTSAQVVGSEYLGVGYASGAVVNGIRHEDALRLSFEDEAMDLIFSNDVLEHVPDYRPALAEACRVLRKPGKLIFSIPFHNQEIRTRPRAVLEAGMLRHLQPEIYHGNPVSEKGSLVFYDYGWDILDSCREAGFQDAYALCYHSFRHGYLGEGGQLIFVAEKTAS